MVATATSAGYGALDIATEYFDQTTMTINAANPAPGIPTFGAPGSFKNITDIQRAIAAVGGGVVAAGLVTKKRSITEMANTVHLAAIPLFEKSLVNFILAQTKSKSAFRARGRGQIQIRNPGAGGGASRSGGVVY